MIRYSRWIGLGALLAAGALGPLRATPESGTAAAEASSASRMDADEVTQLWRRGRSQYLAGEPALAEQTLRRLLVLAPACLPAKQLLEQIISAAADDRRRKEASAMMLHQVANAWSLPSARPETNPPPVIGVSRIAAKLDHIHIQEVNLSGLELGRALEALAAWAAEADRDGDVPKGVNIVLADAGGPPVKVDLTLRGLSLRRLLDLVTDSVGYQYEVQEDAVVVRPRGAIAPLETRFFPVARAAVLRMKAGVGLPGTAKGQGGAAESDAAGVRSFFQLAGIAFDGLPGSTLAYDGSQLIVTQTPRNLDRIRNILARYGEVRQVEIEARFMEVQDGVLDELGINWSASKRPDSQSGLSVSNYATNNRSLNEAFSSQGNYDSLTISSAPTPAAADGSTPASAGLNLTLPVAPPGIPGGVALGPPNAALATLTGILGEFSVNAVVRALSQKNGTELLSSPKVTVLSGSQATITVAQELRYPQAYGQVQSQVGTGNTNGGGSAGVTITAGTPQDFTTRDIGVELKVTPIVEEDNASITLDLNPKVTEFEGFVEYGGASVAISSGTTVTVPSGFYQPIFAVRDISTRVTIWDGATLVMGGLTREDVRTANDKVPVLGNVPVLGRLFRSNGSSSQKRNLLIFVTANLVTPGGAPRNDVRPGIVELPEFRNVRALRAGK